MLESIPVSAIVPTRNRPDSLRGMLASLQGQALLPAEMVVVDASDDGSTREVTAAFERTVAPTCRVIWEAATTRGAAAQRNQGMSIASQPFVWFFDDDILFEPQCVTRLWRALESDSGLGGVNATIVNQRYQPPGLISRALFTILHGAHASSFAGRVIGPAINLLPEDSDSLPEVVATEWLNTGCTIYRRDAMPSPAFDSVFHGYSLMEDLTLSLRVARHWRLANARTARIVHLGAPGDHKADIGSVAAMELVNRHYVMTEILERRRIADYLKLSLWETFGVACCLIQSRGEFMATLRGKMAGVATIRRRRVPR